jgi:hypothetical protein
MVSLLVEVNKLCFLMKGENMKFEIIDKFEGLKECLDDSKSSKNIVFFNWDDWEIIDSDEINGYYLKNESTICIKKFE